MSVSIARAGYFQADAAVPERFAQDLRRADEFIRLAIGAGALALGQNRVPGSCGLVLGTAFGPMQTNFEVIDQVIRHEQTSPTLFSHSVFNAAAGYLSRIFGLPGSALTVTDFSFPFFQALQQARMVIESGRLAACLVLQVETYSDLLADACRRITGDGRARWPAGAVAWLLAGEGDGWKISSLDVQIRPASAERHLSVGETLCQNGRSSRITDPLAAAVAATRLISDPQSKDLNLVITGAYGSVELCCRCGPPLPVKEE
jgi:3-oxoacyl-[acyl-carrier-protein] synthase III